MLSDDTAGASLFLDLLRELESIGAPYIVIGGFAATMYGSTRTTYDIDLVVDLQEEHVEALVAHYPPPRYYADPEQIRESVRLGISFNIVDSERGEKADLTPLTPDSPYAPAFRRRVRQAITWPGMAPLDVWCACPDDVILGKLLAWDEGRSRKHESDIYDMLVFHYLGADPALDLIFDEAYLDGQSRSLGPEVAQLWDSVKRAARRDAQRASV